MKTNTIIPFATAALCCAIFSSCAVDPGYAEYKKQKAAEAAAAGNTYGVPQSNGDSTPYEPAPVEPPYQPLPSITPAPTQYPSPSPSNTSAETVHEIVPGDSLWAIARKYGTTVEAIQAANGLTTTNIRAGKTLTIPGR